MCPHFALSNRQEGVSGVQTGQRIAKQISKAFHRVALERRPQYALNSRRVQGALEKVVHGPFLQAPRGFLLFFLGGENDEWNPRSSATDPAHGLRTRRPGQRQIKQHQVGQELRNRSQQRGDTRGGGEFHFSQRQPTRRLERSADFSRGIFSDKDTQFGPHVSLGLLQGSLDGCLNAYQTA